MPITSQAANSHDDVQAWAKSDLEKSLIPWEAFEDFGGRILTSEADFIDVLGYVPNCGNNKAQGWALAFKNQADGTHLLGSDGLPFFRIRMRHSALFSDGKQAKYLSRAGSGQHAFILPDVHEYLTTNPQAPVILTEG